MANLLTTTMSSVVELNSASASCTSGPPTVAVDISTANLFEVDLQPAGGNISVFTITGVTSGFVNSFTLKITNGTSLGVPLQFNWSSLSAFKWPGGNGPTLGGSTMAAADNTIDILSFTTFDNGTTWYCGVVGANFQ